MKTKMTIGTLKNIELNCNILRACNSIPFALANKVNALGIAAKSAMKEFNESVVALKDRSEQLNELADCEEKTAGIDTLKKDVEDLNKTEYAVDLPALKQSYFEALEIDGDKTLYSNNEKQVFSFRDSYFSLIELGVITGK